jgi:hypothetical protein
VGENLARTLPGLRFECRREAVEAEIRHDGASSDRLSSQPGRGEAPRGCGAAFHRHVIRPGPSLVPVVDETVRLRHPTVRQLAAVPSTWLLGLPPGAAVTAIGWGAARK